MPRLPMIKFGVNPPPKTNLDHYEPSWDHGNYSGLVRYTTHAKKPKITAQNTTVNKIIETSFCFLEEQF